ncbi:hypothetical protein L596_013852 [Steinernema carpocapsae]|uniref:ShKT domain-containing protein n=1 Tax=Steinernema carpocapsae TaxID=34508 RepID=A0A4U5P1G4_STECR|nr:hypothetical protein L596_013852 [Steinernema carpocapsae]
MSTGNEYGSRPYLPGPKCSQCTNGAQCTSKRLCPSTCSVTSPPFTRKTTSTSLPTTTPVAATTEKLISQHPTAEECRDQRSSCTQWAKTGNCLGAGRKFMAQYCSSSCGFCNVTTTNAQKSSHFQQKDICVDLLSKQRCEKLRSLGNCRNPRKISAMMSDCKLTCGFCNFMPRCSDVYTTEECALMKGRGHCENVRLLRAMNERCARTCDRCSQRRRV